MTHENEGGIGLVTELLDEVVVVFVGFALELLVELDVGTRVGKREDGIVQAEEMISILFAID